MYHLLLRINSYLIVRDTDYKSSPDWATRFKDLAWEETASMNYGRHRNLGKPIEDAIDMESIIVASHKTYKYLLDPKNFPELLI